MRQGRDVSWEGDSEGGAVVARSPMRLAARLHLAPAALALYVAAGIVPRAAVVTHHHEGDDREHVHAFALEPASYEHRHGDGPLHSHHDVHGDLPALDLAHGRDPTVPPGGALEVPHHGGPSHAHTQHPYPLAARPLPPRLAPCEATTVVVTGNRARILPALRIASRPRGPPTSFAG
jgi:hypothetical protein